MTKAQQVAKRKLEEAQRNYLTAYGWELRDGKWYHPQIPTFRYNAWEAVETTRCDPKLGWSSLSSSS